LMWRYGYFAGQTIRLFIVGLIANY
jgi:hypothetical protein